MRESIVDRKKNLRRDKRYDQRGPAKIEYAVASKTCVPLKRGKSAGMSKEELRRMKEF
jgi:hypothetical protein